MKSIRGPIFANAAIIWGIEMPNTKSGTIRPDRAGVLPRTFPAKHVKKNRRGKVRPCYARSTTKTGQSWKSTIDEAGKFAPAKCPQCGSIILYDQRGFAGCGACSRTLSRKEREELDSRDPEMIPASRYMDRLERHAPTFEGHANLKRISGKERREKRFLSKCAAGGR